jgi:hypothetical protein
MRYDYVVILKKDSEWTVNLLSLLLCFLSTIIWLYYDSKKLFVTGIHDTRTYISFGIAAILCLGLAFSLITWRRTHGRLRYRYLLLAVALGWFVLTGYTWVAVIFILLAFLEHQTKRPLEIAFHHDRVVLNTMVKEQYYWKDFNNIILKDGLLTLDFANNKLLQKEVLMDDDEDNADEEEFNAYCRDHLAAT